MSSASANELFKMTLKLLERYQGISVLTAVPDITHEGDYGIYVNVQEEFLGFWLRIINTFIHANPDPSIMAIGIHEDFQTSPLERERTFCLRLAFRSSHAGEAVKLIFFRNCIARLGPLAAEPETSHKLV